MNYNRKVVLFALSATFILLAYSCLITFFRTDFLSTGRISIVSDIVTDPDSDRVFAFNSNENALPTSRELLPDTSFIDTATAPPPSPATNTKSVKTIPTNKVTAAAHKTIIVPFKEPALTDEAAAEDGRRFNTYMAAKVITNFSKDTAKPALPDFMKKLVALKKGKRDKVRIAWFGDSMIEGDLLTKTFRKRMQQFFGGYGVGFVPVTSVSAPFRSTVQHKWKGDWKDENFKTSDLSQPLYLSGHTFFTSNGELQLTDKTVPDTNQVLEKSLICGEASGPVDVVVNGETRHYKATKKVNRILLDSTNRHNLDLVVSNNQLPVYGVSIEPKTGVVVDNFSFRGITGLELAKLDSAMLRQLEGENNYDLVVLEYGANLMFRPDDVDYSWYRRHIITVVSRLHKAMPHTEFLVVSTADRAFNYASKWRTATGIDNLVKTQAETAYRNDAAFFNLYRSMGGPGTIVRWADSSPVMANKDYVHPNHLGADALGNLIYEAFMKDFRKASGAAGL